MEKKNITVQDLIDRLNEINDKSIPIKVTIGEDVKSVMRGDTFEVGEIFTDTDDDGEKSKELGLHIVSKGTATNETAQILKALNPAMPYERLGVAFTKFLGSESFARFSDAVRTICKCTHNRLSEKMTEEDKKDLNSIKECLERIAKRTSK